MKLKKISDRVKGHSYYFSHHSSIDRELREYIAHFAKNNKRYPFTISCTSTLELGIDIGSVEKVVQIDAAHSISSLIQRVGRSGRRHEEKSSLVFYATEQWNLTQSLACLLLFREEFIEPVLSSEKPYDILLHQTLSIIKQFNGRTFPQLSNHIRVNFAFNQITENEIEEIVSELVQREQLELIGGELIIGIEGERTVNTKDFYSVFKSDPSFKIIHFDKTIGELPLISTLQPDENILLAARIWKIVELDYKAKKIFVIPAQDGKKPVFFGTGGEVHPRIREKMLEILSGTSAFEELSEEATEALRLLRLDFKCYPVQDIFNERPLIAKYAETVFYSFNGTLVNRSIHFLLGLSGVETEYNEHNSSFTFKATPAEVKIILKNLSASKEQIDLALENLLLSNPATIDFSKWGFLLPRRHQLVILKLKYYDFEQADFFLRECKFVEAVPSQR